MPGKTIVPFITVKSSQIKEIGFDAGKEKMYIRFRNNKLYSYEPVSEEKFMEFRNSESIGSFFHKNFKMNSKLKIQKEEKTAP